MSNTFGIATLDSSGNVLFNSLASTSRYFHTEGGNINSYSGGAADLVITSPSEETYFNKNTLNSSDNCLTVYKNPIISEGVKYNPSIVLTGYREWIPRSYAAVSTTGAMYEKFSTMTLPNDPFGFACFGDDGKMQLSNYYKHTCLIQRGTATASIIDPGNVTYGTIYRTTGRTATAPVTITWPAQDYPPLIFISQSSGWIAIESFVFDGNGKCTGVKIISERVGSGTYNFFTGTTSVTFDYYIYGVTPIPQSNQNYGINIYDPSGNLIFDHTQNPLSIIGAYVTTTNDFVATGAWNSNAYYANGDVSVTYTNTSTYKAALCLNPFMAYSGLMYLFGTWFMGGPYYYVGSCNAYGDFIKVNNGALYYNNKFSNCIHQMDINPMAQDNQNFMGYSYKFRSAKLPFMVAQVNA